MEELYLKVIVEVIIKMAAEKAIQFGAYGISKVFGRAVEDKNHEAAAEIVKNNEDLKGPVIELADEASRMLSASYVVPFVPAKAATADDLLALFVEILNLGISISKRSKADLFLPGSLLGEKSVTIFTADGDSWRSRTVDRRVNIDFEAGIGVGISPCDDPIDLCQQAQEEMRRRRELTSNYISVHNNYRAGTDISSFNTQQVYFRNIGMMKKGDQSDLGVLDGVAPIKDWRKGIQSMLEFSEGLKDLDQLPPEEGEAVHTLSKRLEPFYQSQKDDR